MNHDEISTSVEQIPSISNLVNNSTFIKIKENIISLNLSIMNNMTLINNQCGIEKKNKEPLLKYDKTKNSNFSEIYSSLGDLISNKELDGIICNTILLFKSIKYILENDNNSEEAFSYLNDNLNELNQNEEIFAPYLNFLFKIDSNNFKDNVINFKNKFSNNSLNYQLSVFENNNERYFNLKLCKILSNPLALIHYLEYSIDFCNNLLSNFNNDNYYISNVIFQYNKCLNIIILYYTLKDCYLKLDIDQFNDIFTTFVKCFISLLIEVLLKYSKNQNVKFNLIKNVLKTFLIIGFELELPEGISSNEIYIFSLLGALIIAIKFSKEEEYGIIKVFSKINVEKPNIESNFSDFTLDQIYILVIKKIDELLMKKYSKNMSSTTLSISNINLDDFLISDMFLYTVSYDILKKSIKNFKEKLYWNFTEMCNIIFNKKLGFPKIFKMILMRHLIHIPDNKSLMYNLIQYYYKNQNFRKTKILCDKILSSIEPDINSIDKNSIQFEIETIILFIYIHILIKEEKYINAKNLAILNLERLNEGSPNKTLKYKAQMYLGFCYNKLGEISLNHEDKKKNFDLAKYYFESSSKNYQNNNLKYYIMAQNFMMKKYEEVDLSLQENMDSEKNDLRYVSLNILTLITKMKYEEAIQLCIQTLKNFQNKVNIIYLNKIYFEYFYLKIYKIVILEENKNNHLLDKLFKEMNDVLNALNNQIQNQLKEIKNNQKINNYNDNKQIQDYITNNFQNDENKQLNFSNESKSINKYTSNYLSNIQMEILKNFYILTYILYINNINVLPIKENLNQIISAEEILNEEQNDLIISSIQNILENNNQKAESLLKKLFKIAPYNMVGIKILTQLLLNEKNYSDAYIFCMKGLKIDEKESDLWKMLSEYYINNNDTTKYYECTMKEIENRKYHIKKFLEDLIDKTFI